MTMPNFLIIGAAKAGTTSLHAWLEQHPQIYMSPVKETNFFALEGEKLNFPAETVNKKYLAKCKTNLEAYREQFRGVSNETAIGESSPIYLYHPKAPERIHYYLAEIKLIAVLRNPAERAYSNFLHHVKEDLEPIGDFAQALQEEVSRMRNNWWWGFYYVDAGFYYRQLRRYFEIFEASQIKIYVYEDLKANSTEVLSDIFQFLGVDETFVPDTSIQHNVTGVPKNRLWHQFLRNPGPIRNFGKLMLPAKLRTRLIVNLKNRNLAKPKLPLALKRELSQIYRDDILKLQALIGKDLSSWLK